MLLLYRCHFKVWLILAKFCHATLAGEYGAKSGTRCYTYLSHRSVKNRGGCYTSVTFVGTALWLTPAVIWWIGRSLREWLFGSLFEMVRPQLLCMSQGLCHEWDRFRALIGFQILTVNASVILEKSASNWFLRVSSRQLVIQVRKRFTEVIGHV